MEGSSPAKRAAPSFAPVGNPHGAPASAVSSAPPCIGGTSVGAALCVCRKACVPRCFLFRASPGPAALPGCLNRLPSLYREGDQPAAKTPKNHGGFFASQAGDSFFCACREPPWRSPWPDPAGSRPAVLMRVGQEQKPYQNLHALLHPRPERDTVAPAETPTERKG